MSYLFNGKSQCTHLATSRDRKQATLVSLASLAKSESLRGDGTEFNHL